MKRSRERTKPRRIVLPIVLTLTTLGAIAVTGGAIATLSAGCGDNTPPADAARDAPPDTPII